VFSRFIEGRRKSRVRIDSSSCGDRVTAERGARYRLKNLAG
jgi:hypothetical protein